MKVIIAGSRSIIPKYREITNALIKANVHVTEVVSGCAQGVDTVAIGWGYAEHITVKKFPADWNKYGKKAGILRNIEMGDYADLLLVFWDGKSRGTSHMIDYMNKLGKPVICVMKKDDVYDSSM